MRESFNQPICSSSWFIQELSKWKPSRMCRWISDSPDLFKNTDPFSNERLLRVAQRCATVLLWLRWNYFFVCEIEQKHTMLCLKCNSHTGPTYEYECCVHSNKLHDEAKACFLKSEWHALFLNGKQFCIALALGYVKCIHNKEQHRRRCHESLSISAHILSSASVQQRLSWERCWSEISENSAVVFTTWVLKGVRQIYNK